MGFKKYDGSTWQPITPKKLKGIPYTGTLPATLTGTKAGYLHKYKIYGNTEQTGTPTPENPIEPSECGERTANLFDYIYYFNHAGTGPNVYFNIKGIITLKANTAYTFSSNFVSKTSGTRETPFIACKHDDTPLTVSGGFGNDRSTTITTDATGMIDLYTRTSHGSSPGVDVPTLSDFENGKWVMLNEGSTALPYEPYGYKLPLMSAGQNVDVYIGDDTLSDTEYVDSETGKIYRMVSGILTPVDPPTPFPQIPTTANSTTISWAGEGLAPSEFDSIQEWVDIATYTYTNGEWV